MIDSIEIRNFRCFDKISLKQLKRINIIVGKSASGKTAFLESIFIAAGSSPELPIRVRGWRGLPLTVISDQRAVYEALWKDLFFSFDQEKEIGVVLKGSKLNTRSLVIGYGKQPELIPLDVKQDSRQSEAITPITFSWTDGEGHPLIMSPEVKGGQLVARMLAQSTEVHTSMPTSFYSSSILPSPDENAQYFSELSIKRAETPIVKFIKKEFDFVEGLAVEAFARTPTIYASIRGLPQKMPINFVSSGITKVLSLLLGMANQRGGAILIDEMENGIYWDRLSSIWGALLEFSRLYDVQIFATTHSMECLEAAAHAAAGKNENDFCLLRTEKDNGKSTMRQFSGKAFSAAIDQGGEIR